MKCYHHYFTARNSLAMIGIFSILSLSGCGNSSSSLVESTTNKGTVEKVTSVATGSDVKTLPLKGKLRLAEAPDKAVIGMIYFNTTDKTEYIFDGSQWVPHDKTVDDFYKTKPAKTVAYMGGPYSSGHGPHNAFNDTSKIHCAECHKTVNMVVYFFNYTTNGPAFIPATLSNPNPPKPVYNGSMFVQTLPKTCSNIACHGIAAGTFGYYFPGGDGEPELKTISYDGSVAVTPVWSTTSAGCKACHGNPPTGNVWHSGYHANQGPSGAYNQCQFCHPDASSVNGQGTTITKPVLHNDKTITVQVTYKSTCFTCH